MPNKWRALDSSCWLTRPPQEHAGCYLKLISSSVLVTISNWFYLDYGCWVWCYRRLHGLLVSASTSCTAKNIFEAFCESSCTVPKFDQYSQDASSFATQDHFYFNSDVRMAQSGPHKIPSTRWWNGILDTKPTIRRVLSALDSKIYVFDRNRWERHIFNLASVPVADTVFSENEWFVFAVHRFQCC